MTGEFIIIKNTYGFVLCDDQRYYVAKVNFNKAIDKDIVEFETFNYKGKIEARITKIIKRSSDEFVGILEKSKNFSFVSVDNFSKDVFIPKKKDNNSKNNDIVKIKITSWGDEKLKKKPEGYVIKNFGNKNNAEAIVRAKIEARQIPIKFSDEAMIESKNLKKFDSDNRIDLTNLMHITIDSEDTKDIDDAIYLEKKNDKYILYVSIADVSYYVDENSFIDKEARNRGNSIYLYDRVIPMLPFSLTNDVCSLNPKEKKLAFTVKLEFNKDAKLITQDYFLSIIESKHKLSYKKVNDILYNKDNADYEYRQMLLDMNELSLKLTEISKKRGAMDFEIPEIKLILNDKNMVENIALRNRLQAEMLIENFMIKANEAVAMYLSSLELPCAYRVHEKPELTDLISLNEQLNSYGYSVKRANTLEKRLQKLIDRTKDSEFGYIIHKMILKAMKKAHYEENNRGHFGLALDNYLHFTSPIRRYSDLMTHRILKNALQNKNKNEKIKDICQHISKTERIAMSVEKLAQSIKIAQYMKTKIADRYSAKVEHIGKDRTFVLLDNYVEAVLIDKLNIKISDVIEVVVVDVNIYDGLVFVRKV